MKKLLFVLVCAASLGFWMSCNNGAQELDVTLHSGVDTKSYQNEGTVTAKKVTMVTKRGAEVTYDKDGNRIKPADSKYYYDTVQTLTNGVLESKEYWFYNEWDAGQDITFDRAFVKWSDNVSYNGKDASGGNEYVSNAKTYSFDFHRINDDGWVGCNVILDKSGDKVYQRTEDDWYNNFGTAALEVSGNLEGNFEIKTLLKKLDSKYYDENQYGEFSGVKYYRLDERTVYEVDYSKPIYSAETGLVVGYGYKARKISANTYTYYYTDVKFTKN